MYDPYGNVAIGYTGTVSLTSSDLQALIIPATYSFTSNDAGQHVFPATAVTLFTAGSQSITATDATTSSITGSESNIIVQAAAASSIVVAGFPSPDTAGVAGNISVTLYDAYGNVASGYTGTVAFSGSDSQAILPAQYTFSGGDAGTHTFAVTLETAGTQSITAAEIGGMSLTASENAITVQSAAAKTLAVAGFPATDMAGSTNNVTITAYDAYGNVATGYRGTVAFVSSDGKAILPASYSFSSTDLGSHTFSVTLETAGAQSITVADSSSSGFSGSDTGISVQPGAVAKLVVAGFPLNPTAGTTYNLTVSATDAYGNVVTGYLGTVNLSSTDSNGSFSPTIYTFTAADAGTHSFSANLETAGSRSITASDISNDLSGTETGINLQPAALSRFTLAGYPTSPTAGMAYNFMVSATDAYGNVIAGYLGTLSLSSSDSYASFSPTTYTFAPGDGGSHSFSATLETAGPESIEASDTTQSLGGTETGITVQAAAARSFVVTGFPATPTAGTAYSVTVTAYDAYGNLASAYAGIVALSSSDQDAVLPADYTFTAGDAGTHSFSVSLETAGTQSITATDMATPSIAGSEGNIIVQAAAAQTLAFAGFPVISTAGLADDFTVIARDAFGNVAPSYTGTVAFSSSDDHAIVPAEYTFTVADAGAHTFPLTLEKAGTQSITATDKTTPNITGFEPSIAVQAADASSLAVTGVPATTSAGAVDPVIVTAYDAYGNVATGFSGMVVLSSSDSQASLPPNYTFTRADAGTRTFAVMLETAGTQSITATDTAAPSLTASQGSVTVEAATAKILTVTDFPTMDTAGAAEMVTVTACDSYGNIASGYIGTAAFSSSDGQAVLPANYAFTTDDAGTHRFSITLDTAGMQSIAATDTALAGIAGSESNILVMASTARTLAVAGFPTTGTAGATAQVTVTAFDAYGNLASGYTGTVAFSSSDDRAVLPDDYTFTSGDAGRHAFAVTLETAGPQSITAFDNVTPSLTASESGINVNATTAETLAVSGLLAMETAGAATEVVVTAFDAYGNVADGYTGTVAFSSSDKQAILPAEYTFTAADAGTSTFPITLETAGRQSVTAQDTSSTSITGSESGLSVQAAAARSLVVASFPTADTAGESSFVTVTAYDPYGNLANGYTGTVAFSSSDKQAILPAEYTFAAAAAGTSTFPVTLKTSGPQSITAQDLNDSTIIDTPWEIVVNPAATSALILSGYTSTTAGTAQDFTVTALDPYGNPVTDYTGTIHFESSDQQATARAGLPPDYTFTTGAGKDNGEHSFSATLETAGTQSITARDTVAGTITGAEDGIIVSAAAASRLIFGRQPTNTTAGAPMSPALTVLIEDAYGNLVTSDNSTVSLAIRGGTFESGSNATTADASSGFATFSDIKVDLAGTYSVSAADESLAATGKSDSFTISPSVAARLVIHTQPSATATAGKAFTIQPVGYEQDRFGNLESGDNTTTVTASINGGDGPVQGTTSVIVSGGVATFTNLVDDKAGSHLAHARERRTESGDIKCR